MEEERKSRWSTLRENRNEEYQFVVRDVKSFRELAQYNLTPLNIYIAIATVLLLTAVAIFLLIAFTPLRAYIPGYGSVDDQQEVVAMEATMEEMGAQLESQTKYIENLRRVIHGEVTTADDITPVESLVDTTDFTPTPLSEEEAQLRRELNLDRIGVTGQDAAGLASSQELTSIPLAQMTLVAPVSGEISAGFNPAEGHYGVDILAPKNTAIKSVYAGIVFMSEFTSANGNVIGVQHENNLITFYKHNSQLLKKVGDRVRAGEAVAIIGDTGELSSGPHLHLELWFEGRVVDPVAVLRF